MDDVPPLPPSPLDEWGRFRDFRSITERDAWVRPRHLIEVHPAIDLVPAREGAWMLESWVRDEHQRWPLERLYEAEWGPPADLDPDRRWTMVVKRLRSAFESGRLVVHMERMRGSAPGTGPVQPRPPSPPPPSARPTLTWVEIELVDDGERPVVDEPVVVVDTDGHRRQAATSEAGLIRIDGLNPGPCEVSFPRIDGREWTRPGQKFPSGSDDVASVHRVQPRECMSRIAYLHAFRAGTTLYEHPCNAELHDARRNPDLLWPGDEVKIPLRDDRTEQVETARRHHFRVRSAQRWLRVVLYDSEGQPLREVTTTVQLAGGGTVTKATDPKGLLEVPISPAVDRAVIVAPGYRWPVAIANVRPVEGAPDDGRSGVRRRLANLGSHAAPQPTRVGAGVAGGEAAALAGAFDAVVWDYQLRRGLAPTGRLDEATSAAILEDHGY